MNRIITALLLSAATLSSCSSYMQYNAAATGAMLGGVFGSAIGSINGGWRGSNIGQAVGMVAGAAAGAAVASHIENKKANPDYTDRSSYDDNEGQADYYGYNGKMRQKKHKHISEPRPSSPWDYLEVTNVRFADANHDGILSTGEKGYLIMDIYNRGDRPMANVAPIVTCNNRRIAVSPTAVFNGLAPGEGIRYKAALVSVRRLSDGEATLSVAFGSGRTRVEAYKAKINTMR